ncbi:sodium bicarbonate cotransporter 3-like [Uloborus diversus]|uniref:sodium bicarbonate cotransporter 3-like n=1 Tax=Uloborus diversus TaxID=327109 RepID=UPI00240A4FF3|nr:sodium bicarbonate cotransporter 3-like [Uloborus diversus]
MEEDNEPPVDSRGTSATIPNFSKYDLEDHRACTVYIGYYLPGYRKKGHHKHRHHHKPDYNADAEYSHDISKPVTPPSERVHFILGEEEDGTHEPHPLFSEMEELFRDGKEIEWRETARWIKFEEDVEEGGNRWSKPHVATVSLHSLFELRSCILNGTIILDMDAHNLEEIIDIILDNMVSSSQIASDLEEEIKTVLLRPHRHQHELRNEWTDKSNRLSLIRSLTEVGRVSSKLTSTRNSASAGVLGEHVNNNLSSGSFRGLFQGKNNDSPEESSENFLHKINQAFMRKIPPKAEASNILVGEVESLDKVISAFVRLNASCSLGDLTEVPVPTRFLFILLGPEGNGLKYHEIGRAMATLLSDEVFHGVAYKAKNRLDLLAGVDEFLDVCTVLPPGVWDPSTRIEPPMQTASQEARKKPEPKKDEDIETMKEVNYDEDFNIICNRKLFGGLMADIKRKLPWYLSDFKDCISLQCISSVVYLYFACIAQIITFGSLFAKVTKNQMASTECLLSSLICGTTYSLFSGQPLTLLGTTGPVVVFESMVFDMSEKHAINFLSLRLWIGLWTSLYLFLFVFFNVAALVKYITRFTEEIFALLISTYFIYKAFKNVLLIGKRFPVRTMYSPLCFCTSQTSVNSTVTGENNCISENGADSCTVYVPHIFLMSIILFAGTFGLILLLRYVKRTPFFPAKARIGISDFSVLIAVLFMTGLDAAVGIKTPKLEVPKSYKPALRDWVIPIFGGNPWWSIVFAMIPALLLTVLVFMDQQITAVIVNRKENKLKKGHGYHLDLLVVAFLIAICSIFGLPWFVAATILSITHVNSLKEASQCSTPGDKPHFLGVREQRVTHLLVFILIGLSVFLSDILQVIPMPILYGVFLFMGVSSLKGLQFFERIMLMFMPVKYQPDYSYLRHVPIRQVRMYTVLQFVLFGLLFSCKFIKETAFIFPFLLVAVIFIRGKLGFIFDKDHLKMLDDVMPEFSSSAKEHEAFKQSEHCVLEKSKYSTMHSNNSHANINISEVLMESGMWKSIDQQSHKSQKKILSVKCKKKKHNCKRDSLKSEEQKCLSIMEEEEEVSNSPDATSPTVVPYDQVANDKKNETVV